MGARATPAGQAPGPPDSRHPAASAIERAEGCCQPRIFIVFKDMTCPTAGPPHCEGGPAEGAEPLQPWPGTHIKLLKARFSRRFEVNQVT